MESDLPKALTPLAGKPFVRHILDTIGKIFSRKPIIVTGYKKEMVIDELGEEYRFSVQEDQLGTGHAVMTAIEHLEEDTKHVVVLYADHPLLKAETIQKIVDTHQKSGATLTMATVPLPDYGDWRKDAFWSFGRIIRDENGKILKNVEAKDATEEERMTPEVNPCYFCFDSAWLWPHLAALKNENAQGEYYLTDLVGVAFDEGVKIETVPIDPIEALGANTKEQLELLERLLKENK